EIGIVNLVADHTVLNRYTKTVKGRVQLNEALGTAVSVQVYARNQSTNKDNSLVVMRVYFPPGTVYVVFNLPLEDKYFGANDSVEIGLRYPEKLRFLSLPQVISADVDDGKGSP
ncbi:MAG: hypothetical protein HRT35_32005, partial [Algicola sp.]|nr:hypothetical protein [Algicola sp.]